MRWIIALFLSTCLAHADSINIGISTVPNFKVTLTSNQSVTSATVAKINFDTSVYDVGTYWDGTNHWYKPLVPGTYSFCSSIIASATFVLGADNFQTLISKNGTVGSGGTRVNTTTASVPTGAVDVGTSACMLVPMNGTTDTIEVNVVVTGTSPVVAGSANLVSTFTGYRVSP